MEEKWKGVTDYLFCNLPLFENNGSISSAINNETLQLVSEQYYGYKRSELKNVNLVIKHLKEIKIVDTAIADVLFISHLPYLFASFIMNNEKLQAVRLLKAIYSLDLFSAKTIVDKIHTETLEFLIDNL